MVETHTSSVLEPLSGSRPAANRDPGATLGRRAPDDRVATTTVRVARRAAAGLRRRGPRSAASSARQDSHLAAA